MNLEYVDKAADYKPHSSDKWDESPTFAKHMGEYKIYSTPSNGYATGTHSPYTYSKTSASSSTQNTKHTPSSHPSTVYSTHSNPKVVHTTYSKPTVPPSGSSTVYSTQSGPTVVHSTYSNPSKIYSSGSSTSYKVGAPHSHVTTTTRSYPSQTTTHISSSSSFSNAVPSVSSSTTATSSPSSEPPSAEEFANTLKKIMSLSNQGSLSDGDISMMNVLIRRLKDNLNSVASHGEVFLPEVGFSSFVLRLEL